MRKRLPNAVSMSRVVMAIAILALPLWPTTVTYSVTISIVVAAVKVYGVRRIVTFNASDFGRFDGVEILVPSASSPAGL